MNKFVKIIFLSAIIAGVSSDGYAQQRKSTKRTTPKTTTAKVEAESVAPAPAVVSDSLPVKMVKPSLRRDGAVEETALKDRIPLPYEHLRAEDALYRQKLWREIDAREKINLPFRYAANEDNGNQRFISILMKAIQDDKVTVFNAIDDRFTTPMTKAEVAAQVSGEEITYPVYGPDGNVTGTRTERNEVNLDSFYRFRIKEEVIFDKESSRLFFRILGIAPVKRVYTSLGVDVGDSELFWVYYPDMRETFAKYDVYNAKNYGGRMSWEELFESRMFNGRIYKTTMDNPYDLPISAYKSYADKPILQLMEGERIQEAIFNYEQDLWSY